MSDVIDIFVPIDEDGRIERFVEKPQPEEIVTNLINAGTYVLEPEILNYVPAGEPFSFERVREGGSASIYAYIHCAVTDRDRYAGEPPQRAQA